MIDVKERALCSFEQNALALPPLVIEERPDRIHKRQHPRGNALQLAANAGDADRFEIVSAPERVVVGEQPLDLAIETWQISEIHDADRTAADFVFVGRTDTTARGADACQGIRRF